MIVIYSRGFLHQSLFDIIPLTIRIIVIINDVIKITSTIFIEPIKCLLLFSLKVIFQSCFMNYPLGLIVLRRLFGTDGVRGVINKELTVDFVVKLAYAIGTYFGEGSRILVGRDVRLGGEIFLKAVEAGLVGAGCKVYEAGLITTPGLQYNVGYKGFDGGVMITASHNPPEYNGIKVIDADGIEIPRKAEEEIEKIFFEQKFKPANILLLASTVEKEPNVIDDYIKAIVELVDKVEISKKRFKVLVDPANSVAALTTTRVVRELGGKVYTLNGHLDPLFPGRHPEPTVENLRETAMVARTLEVDFAIGHDSDGDRAIVIDDKGRIHWGDRSAALLVGHLVHKHPEEPKKVYTAVSSSTLVEEYLRRHGVKVVWTRVGSPIIAREIVKGGGLAGFEENGGFMYPKLLPVRDGAMKTALIMEMLAYEKIKLSEMFDRLPKYYPIKTKIPMRKEVALKVVEKVKEIYAGQRMITIDGVKVIGDDYWFLVRPSGTEPLLRVMVEAKDKRKAEELAQQLVKIAKEVASRHEV